MKRLLLPTIAVFLICFFGAMSLAPAVKDSKARLDIVSQWVAPPDAAGYKDWREEADKRKKAVADADERLKQAVGNENTAKERNALMGKIDGFGNEFKKYSARAVSPEQETLLRTKNELDQAKDEFDKARNQLLESREAKATFAKKRELYGTYSEELAEYNGKLVKLPDKEVKQ